MSHLKRQNMPKNWPMHRKGTKYVVRPSFGLNTGLPILIILRDMLKVVKNRKEAKKIIHEKKILINCKECVEEKQGIQLLDKISLVPSKKHYVLMLSESGKFALEEIKESEATQKISKIIDKKMLKGKKIQLNLSDGRNYLANIKCEVNDSVVIDLKKNSIIKCLSFGKGSKVFVFSGKHAGDKGEIIEINKERKMAELKVGNERKNILIKQLMIIE